MSNLMMCPHCGKVYLKETLSADIQGRYFCPDYEDRNNELFEVDEQMVVVLRRLWDLGYWTEFCCSGHYSDTNLPYILFADRDLAPCTHPKNWFIQDIEYLDDNDKLVQSKTGIYGIVSSKKITTPEERQIRNNKLMNELVKWVMDLEPNPIPEAHDATKCFRDGDSTYYGEDGYNIFPDKWITKSTHCRYKRRPE